MRIFCFLFVCFFCWTGISHAEHETLRPNIVIILADDPGEKNNLAAEHPERVKAMDAEIERFLVETDAVVPLPNPGFKPELYDPTKIGVPVKHDPKALRRGPPVAGWTPLHDCRLKRETDTLVMESLGGDPAMMFHLSKPLPAGKYTVELSFSSTAKGQGQFFWNEMGIAPQFIRHRSVLLDVKHDGQMHDYVAEFESKHEIPAVRFDPATGEGEIRIKNIQLRDADGNVVQQWNYERRG